MTAATTAYSPFSLLRRGNDFAETAPLNTLAKHGDDDERRQANGAGDDGGQPRLSAAVEDCLSEPHQRDEYDPESDLQGGSADKAQ
jgi:hypothetical protein